MYCDDEFDLTKERNQYLDKMDFNKMFTFTSFSTGKMQRDNEKFDKHSCVIIAEARPEFVDKYKINEV